MWTTKEFGDGGWKGHVCLSIADCLINDSQLIQAADHLLQALELWTARPYPKGLFDVSHKLRRVYKELGFAHRLDSAMYSMMAEKIGTRLGLPELESAHGREYFSI